jgi:hypothetical protein
MQCSCSAAVTAGGIVGRPISAVEHPAGTRSEPLKHRLLRDRVRDVCSQHPHGELLMIEHSLILPTALRALCQVRLSMR